MSTILFLRELSTNMINSIIIRKHIPGPIFCYPLQINDKSQALTNEVIILKTRTKNGFGNLLDYLWIVTNEVNLKPHFCYSLLLNTYQMKSLFSLVWWSVGLRLSTRMMAQNTNTSEIYYSDHCQKKKSQNPCSWFSSVLLIVWILRFPTFLDSLDGW